MVRNDQPILINTMNYKLACKSCHTPARVSSTRAYTKCMCDEDVRVVNLFPYNDIKDLFVPDNLYLLDTERNVYANVEVTQVKQ